MWKRFDPGRPLAVIVGAVLAGMLAGALASVLLTFTAEPVIDQAIALEESHHAVDDPGEAAEPELVSRSEQKGFGRVTGYALGGGAYGVLFGIAFLSLRRRPAGPRAEGAGAGGGDAFRRSLLAGAFLAAAFTVMPWIKYPPNPPAVGDPATISERQWKYLALIFLSLVVLSAAARLSRVLRERHWLDDERLIAVGLAVVVPLGVICAVLPPYSDVLAASPGPQVGIPANLLWRFRIASLGGNLLLWTVLAVTFGAAAVRRERELTSPVPGTAADGALQPAPTA